MTRRMRKQYNAGQIRRIQTDLARLFPPERAASPEERLVIYTELERRRSPIAEAILILTQVEIVLKKRGSGRTLQDVFNVIVWEGDPPEIEIQFRQEIGQPKYPAISSATS